MKSFAFKITCRFAALATLTTAAVLVTAGFVLDHEVEHGLDVLHDIEVVELTELLGRDGNLSPAEISERIKHDADSDAALFAIQIADARGNVLFRSENLGETILPSGTTAERHWTSTVPFLGRVHLSAYSAGPWRIHIGSPLAPAERVLREYIRLALPLLLTVSLASVGLGYAFSRSTLQPIRTIEATARRIRADNLTERIPVPAGRDELSSLAELLNQTFDRLETSFEQIRRFSADASHELKTPLALIRLNVEKVRARLSTDTEGTTALTDVLEEIGRMHDVIDRLLFLAKAESGAVPLSRVPVEMDAFVAEFAEDARVLSEDRGVRFAIARNDQGDANIDPELLRQLLLNLVANAVAVSAAGSCVQLESRREGDVWRLRVMDEGPGLPEKDLTRIFERFVRLPTGAPGKGHGLGLAISRSIAALHHGQIAAENRAGRSGLALTVTLPRDGGTNELPSTSAATPPARG